MPRMNLRSLVDAVSWQVRGPFAFSPLRDVGFAVREMFQIAEVRARKAIARELQTDLAIDRDRGYLRLDANSALHDLCTIGSSIASTSAGTEIGGKEFFRARFATDDERATLLRAALDRRVLGAVARYLGTLPVIFEADYYCSVPHGPPWSKSQLWHCDDDGVRVV